MTMKMEEDAAYDDAVAEAAAQLASGSTAAPPPRRCTAIRLDPAHPQYRTHRWQRHRRPVIIQPISEPPLVPSSDAASEEKEAFAAWAVGNFGVYYATPRRRIYLRPHEGQPPDGHLPQLLYWPEYLAISKADPADPATRNDACSRIARRFLRNAQTRALSHLRGAARQAAFAAQQEAAGGDQEGALSQLMPELVMPDQGDDEGRITVELEGMDEEELIRQQQELEADDRADQEEEEDPALLEHALDPQHEQHLRAVFHARPSDRNTEYVIGALMLLPPLSPAALAGAAAATAPAEAAEAAAPEPTHGPQPAPAAGIPPPLPAGLGGLGQSKLPDAPLFLAGVPDAQLTRLQRQQDNYRAAFERRPEDLVDVALAAAGVAPAAGTATAGARAPYLRLVRGDDATVTARLTTYTPNGVALPETSYGGRNHPPHVLMPLGEVPSPEDTADLFTLSPDQRTPFLQLAYTFLCELRGQPTEPLRLLITGDAGTGKTHIIAAFEWFAFQHRGSHLVLVVSYMWRAAMNVSSCGYSTVCSRGAPSPDF